MAKKASTRANKTVESLKHDADKRKKTTKKVLDLLADQAVVYPLAFTQLGTAWDPKSISGVRAQGYPGINLNQAKPGSSA